MYATLDRMTGATKGITHRRGLINGASEEYPAPESKTDQEIKRLTALGLLGISLIIAAIVMLKVF